MSLINFIPKYNNPLLIIFFIASLNFDSLKYLGSVDHFPLK